MSSQDFEEYRDVYKDMAEILNRQLVLVACLGNLIERGDHNVFTPRTSNSGKLLSPSSSSEYADIALGSKLKDLDSTWYIIDSLAHDNELRNAIAHNKMNYDDVTQVITYYTKLEGMEREEKREIQLLDYMHRLLAYFGRYIGCTIW
jgi:adenosyl cobinamide kinase/adenosyl cobinamide phosphate guanylyltransferase